MNGHSIRFAAEWEEDTSFLLADISKYVQLGVNSYEVNMDWHQGEDTYYALFGENVTETLKNCIAYESEIEAVYLKGKFGVYSDSSFERHDKQTLCGSGFYIGRVPEQVSDLVTDGFPFLRNKVKLTQKCTPTCALYPKYQSDPFFTEWASGSRCFSLFLVELGASMMVESTIVPFLSAFCGAQRQLVR